MIAPSASAALKPTSSRFFRTRRRSARMMRFASPPLYVASRDFCQAQPRSVRYPSKGGKLKRDNLNCASLNLNFFSGSRANPCDGEVWRGPPQRKPCEVPPRTQRKRNAGRPHPHATPSKQGAGEIRHAHRLNIFPNQADPITVETKIEERQSGSFS